LKGGFVLGEYNLKQHGDYYEKKYLGRFIKRSFPSYEIFWKKYIVPITNRSVDIHDIHIKSDEDLKKIGRSQYDVQIAQLHYTVLRHLISAYSVLDQIEFGQNMILDQFILFIVRICAAVDVADEFLERFTNPNEYEVWNITHGKNARFAWRNKSKDELKYIRDYRNYLLHCPLLPTIPNKYPKFDLIEKYRDWRKITHLKVIPKEVEDDFYSFIRLSGIIWLEVLNYLEKKWKDILKNSNSSDNSVENNEFISTISEDSASNILSPSGASDNTEIEDIKYI